MSLLQECGGLVEVDRSRFGGEKYNKKAINRHSTRLYKVQNEDVYYQLDRTLDADPPFFNLYELPPQFAWGGVSVGTIIPVQGQEYWGDGLTWNEAIALMEEAVSQRYEEESE